MRADCPEDPVQIVECCAGKCRNSGEPGGACYVYNPELDYEECYSNLTEDQCYRDMDYPGSYDICGVCPP